MGSEFPQALEDELELYWGYQHSANCDAMIERCANVGMV